MIAWPSTSSTPRSWILALAVALTTIGLSCIVSPGLFGRRGGFPAESSVQTFGVCTTIIGAMATAATTARMRRRRRTRE